jgi:erythromycin esterase-like protein
MPALQKKRVVALWEATHGTSEWVATDQASHSFQE